MSKTKENPVDEKIETTEESCTDEANETSTDAEVIDAPAEKTPLEKAEESVANLSDRLMGMAAEYDNYKKRSAKEKDEVYSNAVCDTMAQLLPVLDNLDRAILAGENASTETTMLEGVKMVKKQFEDAMAQIGVTPMDATGKPFNPEHHNAVMTEDSDQEENTVLDELMKGYLYKETKVVRHAMVKVSN